VFFKSFLALAPLQDPDLLEKNHYSLYFECFQRLSYLPAQSELVEILFIAFFAKKHCNIHQLITIHVVGNANYNIS